MFKEIIIHKSARTAKARFKNLEEVRKKRLQTRDLLVRVKNLEKKKVLLEKKMHVEYTNKSYENEK